MNRLLTILTVLSFAIAAFGQVNDNFNDGDFTTGTLWIGDDSLFDASGFDLHSNGPAASSILHLSTANTRLANTEWRVKITMDFNPSSTNYVRYYFVADMDDVESNSINGYYLQIGESGSNDTLKIYKQNGATSSLIFTGTRPVTPSSSSNTIGVKLTRDASGNWDVWSDITGTSYVAEGGFTDNSLSSCSYVGVYCRYSTASRNTLYGFDDVYVGDIVLDTDPPTITEAYAVNQNTLKVSFSETVNVSDATGVTNYSIDNGIGAPFSVLQDTLNPNSFYLQLSSSLSRGLEYMLHVQNVRDLASNTLVAVDKPIYISKKGDLLITEFFPDPDTTLSSLPAAEFFEIYNNTASSISLADFQIFDASSYPDDPELLPSINILPGEFVIVCDNDDTATYAAFGKVAGVGSLPSLNNTEDDIYLADNLGLLLDHVYYNDDYYNDENRNDGGFSIERLDFNYLCNSVLNWKASQSETGGTPGQVNSMSDTIEDETLPDLLRAYVLDSNGVVLIFSKELDAETLTSASFDVDNGLGNPIGSSFYDFENKSVLCRFNQNIAANTIYTLTAQNIFSCATTEIGLINSVRFGLAENLLCGDLVINEILFNPNSGGVDFVEIYNRSEKIIDLKKVKVLEATVDEPYNYTDEGVISEDHLLIFPEDYLVVTEKPDNIKENYAVPNIQWLVEMKDLPNFDDNSGNVELYFLPYTIDKLSYYKEWHSPLLDDENGVSLERINYDDSTQSQSNWFSAAASAGYATPTYKNSQFLNQENSVSNFELTPEIFTPNQDGMDDFTSLFYHFDEAGNMINLIVFDVEGRKINQLASNLIAGTEGVIRWDGAKEDGTKAPQGHYVFLCEVVKLDGSRKKHKFKVVSANYSPK